jgi:hypothetical protein
VDNTLYCLDLSSGQQVCELCVTPNLMRATTLQMMVDDDGDDEVDDNQ